MRLLHVELVIVFMVIVMVLRSIFQKESQGNLVQENGNQENPNPIISAELDVSTFFELRFLVEKCSQFILGPLADQFLMCKQEFQNF